MAAVREIFTQAVLSKQVHGLKYTHTFHVHQNPERIIGSWVGAASCTAAIHSGEVELTVVVPVAVWYALSGGGGTDLAKDTVRVVKRYSTPHAEATAHVSVASGPKCVGATVSAGQGGTCAIQTDIEMRLRVEMVGPTRLTVVTEDDDDDDEDESDDKDDEDEAEDSDDDKDDDESDDDDKDDDDSDSDDDDKDDDQGPGPDKDMVREGK